MKRDRLNLIFESRESFFSYVKKCNGNYRLISPSLYLYKKIIEKHRKCNDLDGLLDDDDFLELIYITLDAWNMNQRGAKLIPFEELKKSVLKIDNRSLLKDLYAYKLNLLSENDLDIVVSKIKQIFYTLKVATTKTKIVGISKALHFLLPDLIMPIDRRYTLNTFYGHNKYNQDISKEFKTFKEIFTRFYEIAKELKLSEEDIDNFNWNTSIPKLIDNALIGNTNSK